MRKLGQGADASELHGGLCGWLAGGGEPGPAWLAKVLADPALPAAEGVLATLGEASAAQFEDRDFGFELLLPPADAALAERSDFLFVTLTGGPATRHVVNQGVIEALGPRGSLINVSRASNIDENALLDALESGKLGWAALDVFEGEPRLNPRFTQLDNVLLQPHQASATEETRRAMGALVLDNLAAHF